MPALVRLLGLMRREGQAERKTVQQAMDAVRRGGVGVRALRECGTVPGTWRFFERMAIEDWLRERGS
jgi:hypothetical protein